MTDPKEFLIKLNKNLNTLKERQAKYSTNAPLDLLNQIDDYETAITLTQQTITGQLSEAEWVEALQPLLIAGPGIDLLAVWIVSKYAFDQGVTLGREMGPQASDRAKEIFSLTMKQLGQTPKGEFIAAEFTQDPATYAAPVEKELGEFIRADTAFVEQLRNLLEQFHQALKTHNAAGTSYQATQSGSGLIVQGQEATGIQQGDQGQVIIGSQIKGDVLGPGASKKND